ncbi:MAG: diguanylate cyclase [Spirochaetes bacterium GWD1_27_9]|nr:MAG: diguanylate cyclase [Spirochaetes bacterium GWB1_27_13]OHD38145.1 MAG: diguanylate cyclase [Spirochaetes bacterium GWD1_27_9]
MWHKQINASISVCDKNGVILELNDKAIEMFKKYGGADLIGKNLIDCHPEPSKTKVKSMLLEQTENCYTTEKNGIKKMVVQKPFYQNGEYAGFVEMVFEIPFDMPHFVRK